MAVIPPALCCVSVWFRCKVYEAGSVSSRQDMLLATAPSFDIALQNRERKEKHELQTASCKLQ